MSVDIRMEPVALSIGTALFEKLGIFDADFLKSFLWSVFHCLHFYRNNTKTKTIPVPITKGALTFFANFIINHGSQALIQHSDTIQKDVFLMVLSSEGDKIKHITTPA